MNYINKLYNVVSLFGWVAVQTLVTSLVIGFPEEMRADNSEHFAIPIRIAQATQVLNALDILFIILGVSKGSIIGTLAQLAGRLLVVLVYISTDIAPVPIANVLIAWSIADLNRYLYYLVKSPITTWLRYNGFLVLYPVGIYGEMTVINDYIKKTSLTENQVTLVRVSQAIILIGGALLYIYMLGNRDKKKQSRHQHHHDKDTATGATAPASG